MALTTPSLMSSKSLIALLAWALLATMSSAQQDTDTPWFWIMADSKNSTPVCPGRCLAVNDSTGDYINKRVGFVTCKTADTSSSSSSDSSSSSSTNNQQWLRSDGGTETMIQINATDSTDTQSAPRILCLQPDSTNRSLTVADCTEKRHQKWVVADNTIASLAFDPPRYLAMTYRLAGILDPTEGTGWREAWIVKPKAQNSSLTTTFSMVDGTVDHQLPTPLSYAEPPQSRNFIRNGGFEQSSFDFARTTSNLSLPQSDIFGLCDWLIMKTEANLQDGFSNLKPAEGNRSLYLKDGIVKQNVATSAGTYYTLVFKVHVASPSPVDSSNMSGDQSDSCEGSDTLSVNPYPSTNVHINVEVNGSWATRHVTFQALGNEVVLSLRGCAACGCFLDDLNLMQIIEGAPFSPPPPRPSPPRGHFNDIPKPEDEWPPGDESRPGLGKDRLSNGAVVGLVVGASALFFMIGAAFFAVVCVKEKKEVESETNMRRPPEWSITTTPVQSDRGRGSVNNHDSSNAPTTATSAPQDPSPRTSSTVATKISTSSNPHSGSGV